MDRREFLGAMAAVPNALSEEIRSRTASTVNNSGSRSIRFPTGGSENTGSKSPTGFDMLWRVAVSGSVVVAARKRRGRRVYVTYASSHPHS
jgi:hypothetical protein